MVAGPLVDGRDSDADTILMQELLGENGQVQEQVQWIQRIQHPAFLAAREIFCYGKTKSTFSVSFDFMPISLAELVGNPLLAEIHYACILGQVLEGLVYLEQNKLEHGHLTCATILVDQGGNVKIWGYENAHDLAGETADVAAFGRVALELVQGFASDGDVIDMGDQTPRVADFLEAAMTIKQASALAKHRLFDLPWRTSKNHVKSAAALGMVWAKRGYRYPAA
ncbi:hypothetical protein SEUCBS139899_004726 [Sporothrix eucalyptigena]